ncbi:MAG TPA: AAA family ATPase [Pirellulales bacterium]|jgi:uncharacterized protein YhaN|nr:AAA family ATPase [Pirellulales bacterium]
MKLTDIHIDGFGVWSGLTLADLSPECTVFYGPNEAGKTTLLQFVRAVLYGFSPRRTARYLPALGEIAAGGSLTVLDDEEGRLEVQRHQTAQQPLGDVLVGAADGTVQGEAQLQRLLQDVDETIFQNVFAVSLHELQELGALTDSDAARWLYDLSLGFDRVSLSEVLGELENSRRRLWSDTVQSQIGQLLSERERLRTELAEFSKLSTELNQLIADRAATDQQIAQLEAAVDEQEVEHRTRETAAALMGPWQRRRALNAQIEALGSIAQWPADAPARMSRLLSGIHKTKREQRFVLRRRKLLSRNLAQLKLNRPLVRQSARIEALAENESWIVSLEKEIRQAEEAAKRLTAECQTPEKRLNDLSNPNVETKPGKPNNLLVSIDRRDWRTLRRPAAELLHAERQSTADQQKVQVRRAAEQNRLREAELVLAAQGPKNLAAALDAAGQRVSQLRRRVQLDGLLQQLADTKADLEHSIAGSLQRQVLPAWMLLSLGGVFVLGVVLILGGLLLPGTFTGSLGWPMAGLGVLGMVSAVAAKYSIERSAASRLEASRQQLALVGTQVQQAEAERSDLDRNLPKGAGSLQARLQTAQQELAKLEDLLPLEAQRQAADQALQAADSQNADFDRDLTLARQNWKTALSAVGLPENFSPRQARALYHAGQQLDEAQRQLTDAQAELERHRRELGVFTARLEQVFLAAEIPQPAGTASEQLRDLRRALAEQETRQQQRRSMIHRQKKLRRRGKIAARRLGRLRGRAKKLLVDCRVPNLAEFRQRSAEFSQISSLIAQRDSAAQEIASLLTGATTNPACQQNPLGGAMIEKESFFASLVANASFEQLNSQLASSRQHLEDLRRQQQRLFEERGQRSEQIRRISCDRQPAVKRFELAQIEQHIAAALQRWKILTLTHHWLVSIKEHYERHRQPEALRDASEFMTQLTEGRYRRVWTRWGENTLLVDDDEDRTLTVEVLSQGAREQLFLSLRLAIVGLYARRGVQLPMVLDDVLVNFDTQRAGAAVRVLRDFSRRGHQLLVFTCHEHLASLFKSCKMDVRRLPSNRSSGRDEPYVDEANPPPRRHRPRRQKEEAASPPVMSITSVATAQAIGPAVSVETQSIAPAEVYPVEVVLPFLSPQLEPVAQEPSVPLRVDMPQSSVRLSPIMRRWAAEEFSGELDDRINPLWLLDGTAREEAGTASARPRYPISETEDPASPAAGRTRSARYFAEEPAFGYPDRPLGDDGLES